MKNQASPRRSPLKKRFAADLPIDLWGAINAGAQNFEPANRSAFAIHIMRIGLREYKRREVMSRTRVVAQIGGE